MSRDLRFLIAAGAAACSAETADVAESRFAGASDDGAVAYVLDFGEPPTVGFASPEVTLADADGEPIRDAALGLTAVMPEHGHGPADPAEIEDLGDGAYRAAFTLPMAGAWEITLDVGGAHPWTADVVVD